MTRNERIAAHRALPPRELTDDEIATSRRTDYSAPVSQD
jgi:hypothetical protein